MKLKQLLFLTLVILSSQIMCDSLPDDWYFYSDDNFEYDITESTETSDTKVASLKLDSDNGNAESYGTIKYSLSATDWINKRIKLYAVVEKSDYELEDAWLSAYIVDKNYDVIMSGADYNTYHNQQAVISEVIMDVPENAYIIRYGLSQRGQGITYINLLPIEEVSKYIPVKNLSSEYISQKDMLLGDLSIRVDGINQPAVKVIEGDDLPIALSSISQKNEPLEWWLIREDEEEGVDYYNLTENSWVNTGSDWPSVLPVYQGQSDKFTDFMLSSTKDLKPGQYDYYFGYDNNVNNQIDLPSSSYEKLTINIQHLLQTSNGKGGLSGEYEVEIDDVQLAIYAPSNTEIDNNPLQVAYYFHGDGANTVYGWTYKNLRDWAKSQSNVLIVGLYAPNERRSWWRAFLSDQNKIHSSLGKVQQFVEGSYNVYQNQNLYGGVSGGSTLLSYIGSQLIGNAVLTCGSCGGYEIRPTIANWENHLNLHIVYGDQDFMVDSGCIPDSIDAYQSYGVNVSVKEFSGVEHCDFDTADEIIQFWEKHRE